MGSLPFKVLGPVQIDGSVDLGGPKQRALLAVVLLRPNRTVSRERLIDTLWPENPPETARHALQVYVSKLRKALPGEARLLSDGNGYRLQVDEELVDATSFERLVADVRPLLHAQQWEQASRALRDATALWRGTIEDAPADDPERLRLEELRLTAIEERVEAELELGRHTELVPELEALVAAEPLRERLRRQLMLALYRAGRQADALAVYQEARTTFRDELGLEPGPELRALEQAVLRQDSSLVVEPAELRARRRLPAPATPLIGRRRELEELHALLADGARLVTLTGPGGIGKTRLGLQAAHELAHRFRDGVVFVALAPLRDPALVLGEIVSTLGLDATAELEEELRDRQLLLLVDNFEQVDEAAPELGALLTAAPRIRLIVTSRQPLRLYGEHDYPVPALNEEEAAALFSARAKAVHRRFAPQSGVAELCERLDRLPLAIELVAARAKELSVEEMLATVPALELATGGPRDAPARQQSLRNAIAWSHDLLGDDERRAFARVSVFADGFSPDSALAVCGADREVLGTLVASSLLKETSGRLEMLETIREFAHERLENSGEAAATRRRHATHFLELAERAEPELSGSGQDVWLERIAREHDNLRVALDWAADEGAGDEELRLAVALRRFWLVRGHVREAQGRLERALARPDGAATPLRATAAGAAGQFALRRSDYGNAHAWTEESLELFRKLDDGVGIATSLNRFADIAKAEGDAEASARFYAAALEVARKLDDRRPLATALTNAGAFALQRHDPAAATALTEEAYAIWNELGHEEGIAVTMLNLGMAAIEQDRAEAAAYFADAFALARRLEFASLVAEGVAISASVAARADEKRRAARLVGAANELFRAADAQPSPLVQTRRDEALAAAEAALSAEDLGAALEMGRTLSVEEAIADAVDTVRSAVGADRTPSPNS